MRGESRARRGGKAYIGLNVLEVEVTVKYRARVLRALDCGILLALGQEAMAFLGKRLRGHFDCGFVALCGERLCRGVSCNDLVDDSRAGWVRATTLQVFLGDNSL